MIINKEIKLSNNVSIIQILEFDEDGSFIGEYHDIRISSGVSESVMSVSFVENEFAPEALIEAAEQLQVNRTKAAANNHGNATITENIPAHKAA